MEIGGKCADRIAEPLVIRSKVIELQEIIVAAQASAVRHVRINWRCWRKYVTSKEK
jgi:hypothetical protein